MTTHKMWEKREMMTKVHVENKVVMAKACKRIISYFLLAKLNKYPLGLMK